MWYFSFTTGLFHDILDFLMFGYWSAFKNVTCCDFLFSPRGAGSEVLPVSWADTRSVGLRVVTCVATHLLRSADSLDGGSRVLCLV